MMGKNFAIKKATYRFNNQVLSRTSGNSSKFFVSSIAVTLTGKAAGRSLIMKRERLSTMQTKAMVKTLMLHLMCSQSTVLNQGNFFTSFTPEILNGGCF